MAKILNHKNSRQINIKNFEEIKKILRPLELRRDLLIEHLHLIQDNFGHISEDSIISLSTLLKLSIAYMNVTMSGRLPLFLSLIFFSVFIFVSVNTPKPF